MSIFGKLETEVEAKAPAYKFHEVNSKRIHETTKICPRYFQKIDLKEGEWGGEGSVTCWYFIIGRITKIFNLLFIFDIIYLWILQRFYMSGLHEKLSGLYYFIL